MLISFLRGGEENLNLEIGFLRKKNMVFDVSEVSRRLGQLKKEANVSE